MRRCQIFDDKSEICEGDAPYCEIFDEKSGICEGDAPKHCVVRRYEIVYLLYRFVRATHPTH